MSVAAMIETSRLQSGVQSFANGRIADSGVSVSPAGSRFATLRVRGDVNSDHLIGEVITASLRDLAAASQVVVAARLTARMRGHDELDLAQPLLPVFTWLDERHVLFRWVAADGTIQLFRLDLETRALEQATHHPTSITYFAAHPNGVVIFTAKLPGGHPAPSPLLQNGGVIESDDAYALARGELGPSDAQQRESERQWFVQRRGGPARPIEIDGRWVDRSQSFSMSIAPDGTRAVIAAAPAHIPASWDGYTEPVLRELIADDRRNPGRGLIGNQLKQLYLVDLGTGRARVALAAPAPLALSSNVVWSADSRSFLVGPTSLPMPADGQGRGGSALIEIAADDLRIRRLPIPALPLGHLGRWDRLDFASPDLVVVRHGSFAGAARRDGDAWREAPVPPVPIVRQTGIRVELEQDLNVPPVLVAADPSSGTRRTIFDPNPSLLRRFLLGRVEERAWRDPAGRNWNGTLYFPVGFRPGRLYPLVIQTHGRANPRQFSLNGMGGLNPATGPGISNYAAQPLAGRGMFVLQLDDSAPSGAGEAEAYASAYESAIGLLSREGLVDPARVGISGFSRTGWHVLYALTHADIEFAAALVSDNMDGGYFQGTLIPGSLAYELGALPFGKGLERWLNDSPAFSAERIRAPLRLEREQAFDVPNLLGSWELFSRLRQLGHPVEYYVVPDVLHGSHTQQNPKQLLASQQGAVDWFDFWLNGRERGDPSKREQYARWRAMRAQLAAIERQPRPKLLQWHAQEQASSSPSPH